VAFWVFLFIHTFQISHDFEVIFHPFLLSFLIWRLKVDYPIGFKFGPIFSFRSSFTISRFIPWFTGHLPWGPGCLTWLPGHSGISQMVRHFQIWGPSQKLWFVDNWHTQMCSLTHPPDISWLYSHHLEALTRHSKMAHPPVHPSSSCDYIYIAGLGPAKNQTLSYIGAIGSADKYLLLQC
jgi:hypothetical protein